MNVGVDEKYRGRGIATELNKKLNNSIDTKYIAARIEKNNKSSIKNIKKSGFKSFKPKGFTTQDKYFIKEASKLKSSQRDALPSSAFVFPETRKYPIHDESHARSALSLGAKHATPEQLAKIKSAVKRRYPDIEVDG